MSLKVRVGRPNGTRERYCDGTIGRVRPTLLAYLDSDRFPRELPKSRKLSSSEQTREKVRRRLTLLVTARVGGMTGQATTLLVVLAVVIFCDSPGKGQR